MGWTRAIGRRERGAVGGALEGAAPFWKEASRAEVRVWEQGTTEAKDAFVDVEERQRHSRILRIIAKRLTIVGQPLRAPTWAIQPSGGINLLNL
jgi:hypothetical protein